LEALQEEISGLEAALKEIRFRYEELKKKSGEEKEAIRE